MSELRALLPYLQPYRGRNIRRDLHRVDQCVSIGRWIARVHLELAEVDWDTLGIDRVDNLLALFHVLSILLIHHQVDRDHRELLGAVVA